MWCEMAGRDGQVKYFLTPIVVPPTERIRAEIVAGQLVGRTATSVAFFALFTD
jgi:hypothetical protein